MIINSKNVCKNFYIRFVAKFKICFNNKDLSFSDYIKNLEETMKTLNMTEFSPRGGGQ